MCLGTTVTCLSCRKEVFSFYRGGRCGEKKPFPVWHRVRGRQKRIRRCRDCIVHDERAALQESYDYAREVDRAKAALEYLRGLSEYLRGERPCPTYEESPVVPSNVVQTPFDLDSLLDSYFDTLSEIRLIADTERALQGHDEHPSRLAPSARQMMQSDNWREYLEGSRLHPFTPSQAERVDELVRYMIGHNPENMSIHAIYTQMDQCVTLQSNIETTGRELNAEGRLYRFSQIALDLEFQLRLLYAELRGGPVTQRAQEQHSGDDNEEDDYREHEPPEISFQQWAFGQYRHDSTYNIDLSVEEALAVDVEGYEAYLHAYANNLQYSDFANLQRNLPRREFVFDPGELDGLSFSQWFTPEGPQYARHRGLVQLALPDYWREVVTTLAEEIQQAAVRARTFYFEEHRRELYGHARYEHSPLIQRFRVLRAQATDIMEWTRREHPEQLVAYICLEAICTFLTVQIAIEAQPTAQQWQAIRTIAWDAIHALREAASEGPQREHEPETAALDPDPVEEANQHRLYCLRLLNLDTPEVSYPEPPSSPGLWLDMNIDPW